MPLWVRHPRDDEEARHATDWCEAFMAGCDVTRRHLLRVLVLPLLALLALAVATIIYQGLNSREHPYIGPSRPARVACKGPAQVAEPKRDGAATPSSPLGEPRLITDSARK